MAGGGLIWLWQGQSTPAPAGGYPGVHTFAEVDGDGFPKAPKKRKSVDPAKNPFTGELEEEELLLLLGLFDD